MGQCHGAVPWGSDMGRYDLCSSRGSRRSRPLLPGAPCCTRRSPRSAGNHRRGPRGTEAQPSLGDKGEDDRGMTMGLGVGVGSGVEVSGRGRGKVVRGEVG